MERQPSPDFFRHPVRTFCFFNLKLLLYNFWEIFDIEFARAKILSLTSND